jgi:predicted transcriptional regulator
MKSSVWNKIGFILASSQRTEVFRLIIHNQNQKIDEIEKKAKKTKNVRRILKDFDNEGIVKINKDRIKLSKTGMKILKLLEKGHFKVLTQ